MSIPFKVFGWCALSLSLLVSGCGDREDGDGSGSGAEVSFKPLVTKDAKFAIAINLDRDQAFKIADSYVKMASDMHMLDGEALKKAKEMIEACRKDILSCCDCDPKMLGFIEKSGLRDAELTWVALSTDGLEVVNGEQPSDGFCVAIGGKLDLEKAIAVCQGEKDCEVSFAKVEIEGEKAWRIALKGDGEAEGMKGANVDTYVASLGGRLSLVAMSREALAKQIRLYRSGAEMGDALGGFSAAKGELLRLHLSGIGELVKQYVPQGVLREIGYFVPDGDGMAVRLQNLTIDTKVQPDGKLSETIRLKAASEEDADTLRTLAKVGLMAVVAEVSKDPGTPEGVKKILREVKIAGSDGAVEVRSGISFVGTVAGAFFPALSRGILCARTGARR